MEGVATSQQNDSFPPFPPKNIYINPPKLFVYLFPFQVKTAQHMRKAIKLTRHAFIEKT